MKAIDFFCGGGGMSFGMQEAGITILAGIDNNIACRETYEANIGKNKFVHADVFELKETDLENTLKIKVNDDDLILIGCSPCQFWSIINTDKGKAEKSKNLLVEFKRFVEYFNPGYVVVENVPGVLRKKKESGLESLISWLIKANYKTHFKIHNTNDYGVPQNRKRFTLIANRIGDKQVFPKKDSSKGLCVRDVLGIKNGFSSIKAGHKDKTEFLHSVPNITSTTLRRLKMISKDGGNRFEFASDPELQLKCFIGKNSSFADTFGRLWWDRPSPTITTKFTSVSNGRFVHPEENRALSIREGAVLQSFPKSYRFYGKNIPDIAKLIGNAVPPEYAKRIGEAILGNQKNG